MITKRGGFRPWVKQIMPTVFDESLSYYELLSKVIGFLNQLNDQANEIIDYLDENVNEQNEEITRIRLEMLDFTKDTDETIAKLQADFSKFKTDSLATQLAYINELRSEFDLLKARIEMDILPENIASILNTWFDNGKLALIINEAVFDMKADKEDLTALEVLFNEKMGKTESNIINVNSFSSINNAVTKLKETDSFRLFFPKGTYTLTDPIIIDGMNGLEIDGNGSTIILNSRFDLFCIYNSKNVTIKNFNVVVNDLDRVLACRLVRAENIQFLTLNKLTIDGGALASIRSNDIGGFCENVVITECSTNGDLSGIGLRGVKHVLVDNNVIRDMTVDGIKVSGDRNENIVISNNDISLCLDDGIDFYADSRYVTFENNYVYECGKPFNYKFDGDQSSDDNQQHSDGTYRVYNVVIRNNRFRKCSVAQILNASNLLLEGNEFSEFEGDYTLVIRGENKRSPQRIKVKSNLFEKNNSRVHTVSIFISPVETQPSDVTLSDNYFKNNNNPALLGEVMMDAPATHTGKMILTLDKNTFIGSGTSYVSRFTMGDNTVIAVRDNVILSKVNAFRINSATEKSMLIFTGNEFVDVTGAQLWLSTIIPNIRLKNNISNHPNNWGREQGTTAQRPVQAVTTPIINGSIYYDETLGKHIKWVATQWLNLDGSVL